MAKKKIQEKTAEDFENDFTFDISTAENKMPGNINIADRRADFCNLKLEFLRKYHGKTESDFTPMSEQEFQNLVRTIKEVGVLEPISVLMVEGENGAMPTYEVLAGEHRWRASVEAGLETIPARVYKNLDEATQDQIYVITNLVRRSLSFSDKVAAWYKLMKRFNEKGSGEFNSILKEDPSLLGDVSLRQISRYCRMYHLIPELKAAVEENRLSQRCAYLLAYLDEDEQHLVLPYISSITEENAKLIRAAAAEGELDETSILGILKKKREKNPFSVAMTNVRKEAKKILSKEALDNFEDIFSEAIEMYLQEHPEYRKKTRRKKTDS